MGKGVVSCFLIAFIISCTSIKEDRRECPCWFSVDFSKVSHDIENLHLWFFDEDGELLKRDTLSVPDYNNVYEIELKRGTVGFYVWGNISGDTEINKPFSRGAFCTAGAIFSPSTITLFSLLVSESLSAVSSR